MASRKKASIARIDTELAFNWSLGPKMSFAIGISAHGDPYGADPYGVCGTVKSAASRLT